VNLLHKLFEEKIADSNVIKVTKKAASRFRGYLSREEINNCINIAIWKSLKKYKEDAGLKFTTYVYRGVILECTSQKKKNFPKKKSFSLNEKNFTRDTNSFDFSLVLEELERQEYGQMVIDKYINNFTTKEIAIKNNSSIETIRKKISQTIENVKLAFN
jgi:DNA-directed RNA polymerase specialized sigma24 family protein